MMKELDKSEDWYNLISKYCKEVYNTEVSVEDVSRHSPLIIFSWLEEAKKHYGFYGKNTFNYGDRVRHSFGVGKFMCYDLLQDNMCTVLFDDDSLVEGVIDKIDISLLEKIE